MGTFEREKFHKFQSLWLFAKLSLQSLGTMTFFVDTNRPLTYAVVHVVVVNKQEALESQYSATAGLISGPFAVAV